MKVARAVCMIRIRLRTVLSNSFFFINFKYNLPKAYVKIMTLTKTQQKTIPQRLKREMTLGDVLQEYPDAAPLLTEKGIHCVGCHVSPFETVEEGFHSHGMSEEEIDTTLAELNEKLHAVLQEKPQKKTCSTSTGTLNVTDLAVSKVLELMKKEQKDPKTTALRIAVIAGGCSGYRYDFAFMSNKKEAEDIVIEKDGLTILTDTKSIEFMDGAVVDYTESLHGAGFVVTNPKATGGCGCGKSFS